MKEAQKIRKTFKLFSKIQIRFNNQLKRLLMMKKKRSLKKRSLKKRSLKKSRQRSSVKEGPIRIKREFMDTEINIMKIKS